MNLLPTKTQSVQMKGGFTLVETLVAILILVVALGALFTLASGALYSVRASRNQTTATYLAQESMDYVRNMRDNASLQAVTWQDFLDSFNVDSAGNIIPSGGSYTAGCFSSGGCSIDTLQSLFRSTSSGAIRQCGASAIGATCDFFLLYTPPKGGAGVEVYGYPSAGYPLVGYTTVPSGFKRTVFMRISPSNPDELLMSVRIEWFNSVNSKSVETLTVEQSILNL